MYNEISFSFPFYQLRHWILVSWGLLTELLLYVTQILRLWPTFCCNLLSSSACYVSRRLHACWTHVTHTKTLRVFVLVRHSVLSISCRPFPALCWYNIRQMQKFPQEAPTLTLPPSRSTVGRKQIYTMQGFITFSFTTWFFVFPFTPYAYRAQVVRVKYPSTHWKKSVPDLYLYSSIIL